MKATYKLKHKLADMRGKYLYQNKGDTSRFRYPHLKSYFRNFDTDLKNDVFILNREEEDTLKNMGIETLDIVKNLSEMGYYEFIFNILGIELDENEKLNIYKDICRTYKSSNFKKKFKGHYNYIRYNNIHISKKYEDIKKYINHSNSIKTIIYKVNDENNHNLAYSMHGTNILYIDKNEYNFGVGILEALINNENGIKGKNNKNLEIEEKYANVKLMALDEYINGFKKIDADLFFMKGYLALAFQKKEVTYNALYALTEPFMKLLYSTINMEDLMEYVINDNSTLKEKFENVYPQFYDKIYNEKNLFKRIDIIKELALTYNLDPINLYKILFNKEKLLNTKMDYKLVAFLYLSKFDDKKLLYDMIVNCYPWCIQNNETLSLENWSKHVLLKYGESKYKTLVKKYDLVKDIIVKL